MKIYKRLVAMEAEKSESKWSDNYPAWLNITITVIESCFGITRSAPFNMHDRLDDSMYSLIDSWYSNERQPRPPDGWNYVRVSQTQKTIGARKHPQN